MKPGVSENTGCLVGGPPRIRITGFWGLHWGMELVVLTKRA